MERKHPIDAPDRTTEKKPGATLETRPEPDADSLSAPPPSQPRASC